jgi:hypothetical protein
MGEIGATGNASGPTDRAIKETHRYVCVVHDVPSAKACPTDVYRWFVNIRRKFTVSFIGKDVIFDLHGTVSRSVE